MFRSHLAMSLAASVIAAAAFTPASFAGSSGQQSSSNDQQQMSQQSSQQSSQQGEQGQSSSNASKQKAPEGFVLLDEQVIYLTAQEPQNHFMFAMENMARNKDKQAAAEINIAARYIDLQSSQAQGKDQQQLKDAANRLRDLSKDVAQGKENKPVDVKEVSDEFAKANLALANHFDDCAKADLDSHKVRAGHELASASTSYRQAVVWANSKPQQQDIQVINESQQAARSLIVGSSSQSQGSSSNQQNTSQSQDNTMSQQANSQGNTSPQDAANQLGKSIDKLDQQIAQNEPGQNKKNDQTSQNSSSGQQNSSSSNSTASNQ